MKIEKQQFSVATHFQDKQPIVREIYKRLLQTVRPFGRVLEEPKKTSIHLVNSTAFAGVATRKESLILTIKSDRKLVSPRVHKSEQVSANRFHIEVKLTSADDVNDELKAWLRNAHTLSS
jgi:hypothetical protein